MDKFHLCPRFEAAFQILGKRWTGLIIRSLLSGSKRFSELQEIIPALSSRVLTERFKELEELGIVTRSVYPEMPVRIEYGLTEKGKDLEKTMDEIQKWAEKWPDK
ncbi:winged helix-turn-helix transcriptional regulator [Clostridium estertheticum]|uniref:HxlR family transcriptional regulator n=2 Tax=Clostridium estertheticum TaxID=238834 RepID=A0A1J0GDC5_9CLOT|nr:helix-turn-helix domain-containing protein [Clostridium estertheticum]APC39361.1 HxlR family transcriptional regulator [Clostridium estertheticum subsp. estertheticum]MBU3072036.1 helix-turn-helix transcriptional regulator [Clostridium estertheticum]MBU3162128.1 helix-turn-helix transcriptional regulator [Clostridium estertheticum]MBU3170555.1 helix-turn-helix transcriptional regulator [Clostridium estertheticum]MBU3184810.1 helix-turn-helix transcriptional regulator [Clostridium estertheti